MPTTRYSYCRRGDADGKVVLYLESRCGRFGCNCLLLVSRSIAVPVMFEGPDSGLSRPILLFLTVAAKPPSHGSQSPTVTFMLMNLRFEQRVN